MSDYDTDILLWSERQADALRRRAANEIDWDNVAEEIEDMGSSVVRAVASHLVQAILHDLKAEAWPLSREASQWRAEARMHRDEARAAYAARAANRSAVSPCAQGHAGDDRRRRPAASAAGVPSHASGITLRTE